MGTTLEAMAETPGLSLRFHFVRHPQLLIPLCVIRSQKSPLSIPILSTHLDLLTCQESPLHLQAQCKVPMRKFYLLGCLLVPGAVYTSPTPQVVVLISSGVDKEQLCTKPPTHHLLFGSL